MINLDDCIELGFLTKPHGIKGHLVMKLANVSFDEIEEMELVFVMVDGLPVPFFIEEFSERNNDAILIKLADIDSEPEARKYTESVVFLDRNVLIHPRQDQPNISIYKGFEVIDKQHGLIGLFESLLDYDQNPVMQILKDRREILIPFNQEFLLEIDEEKHQIHVDCPDGLLELYLD